MSRLERLRSLVNQRINAAADDISRLLEGKISEYEEEVRFFREENNNLQQKLLQVTAKPDVRIFVVGEDEAGPSVDQKSPDPSQESSVTPASGNSDRPQQKQPEQDEKDSDEDEEAPGTTSAQQTDGQQSTKKSKRRSASGRVPKSKRSRN